MDDLDGKTVVCVGGSSGMGYGVARAATDRGARVIVTSRTPERAESAALALGCDGMGVDITDDSSVQTMFENVGAVDHLMITAGAVGRSAFREAPPGEAPAFMNAKLWGTHRCLWYGRNALDAAGSITLITGGFAQWATEDAAHVHVAFGAVEALARATAVSLAPIRCNVIRPGFVDSPMWDFMQAEDRERLRHDERDKTLTGRLVTADDIGDIAVSLMVTRAVTGAVIPVDGGRHLVQAR